MGRRKLPNSNWDSEKKHLIVKSENYLDFQTVLDAYYKKFLEDVDYVQFLTEQSEDADNGIETSKQCRNQGIIKSISFFGALQRFKSESDTKKYSPAEILKTLEMFKNMVGKINELQPYIPLLEDYCSILGISSTTFCKYKNGSSSDYEDATNLVIDYIASFISQGVMLNALNPVGGIFYAKSMLGRKENDPSVMINNNQLNVGTMSTPDLMKKYNEGKAKSKDD